MDVHSASFCNFIENSNDISQDIRGRTVNFHKSGSSLQVYASINTLGLSSFHTIQAGDEFSVSEMDMFRWETIHRETSAVPIWAKMSLIRKKSLLVKQSYKKNSHVSIFIKTD